MSASRFRFRIWDSRDHCWLKETEPVEAYMGGGFAVLGDGDHDWRYEDDERLVRMQSTGLLDSNGVEVFEGDILHGCYGIPPVGVWSAVEWRDGVLGVDTTGHNPDWADVKTAVDCLSAFVEGNIYENKELLERL